MKPVALFLLTTALTGWFATTARGQSTTVKLPTQTNMSDFTITDDTSNVLLKVFGDGGFYLRGDVTSGIIPVSGSGGRMLWYPGKKAFRAGFVSSTQWDDANIGTYSTATGNQTMASGSASTAFGSSSLASGNASMATGAYSVASGLVSTALGYITTASGDHSTAMGELTNASGIGSTAMGSQDTASGPYSTAMGFKTSAKGYYGIAMGYQAAATIDYAVSIGSNTTASNNFATALGEYTTASGQGSTAMGANTTASGQWSTATGYSTTASGYATTAMGSSVSTNGFTGAFIIGDYALVGINSSAENQMTMRFDGGYRLFSKWDLSTGVTLASGGGSWSSISDSTKKTKFLKADEEYFLKSLSDLRLGSWNYKTQDPKEFRHYGPMAQEIFHYFGHDAYGTIGNDTTLASADMDGIMMICLQALEKRTRELREAQEKVQRLETVVEDQATELRSQQESFGDLRRELVNMKNDVRKLVEAERDRLQTGTALATAK